eukprot:5462700-Amphidinium_carterae.1
MRIVRETRPRAISPPAGQCQVLFTDGACESVSGELQVSCGAVLFDSQNFSFHTFGVSVDGPLLQEWQNLEQKS